MLNIQELVNYINNALNSIGVLQVEPYAFNIMAEVGEQKNADKINGIMLTMNGNNAPVENYHETRLNYVVALAIPTARTNYNIINVEGILGQFIASYNAKKVEFTSGNGILSISMGKPEKMDITFGSGETTPIYFTVDVLYTEGAVTSADRKWFLDGQPIPFLTDAILLDKDGNTNKISGKYYTRTILTGQTKRYNFTFPFDLNSELCTTLQRDILAGDFKKQYELTYFDGASYTEEEPYTTRVSIFQNADNKTQKPSVAMFNITFIDVDDGSDRTVYEIALIDNPFDNQTEDTRYFDSQSEQVVYYEDKITNGCGYERIKAPNLNSLDITSQIYENTRNYELIDLTNKNYAIIRVTRGQQGEADYYRKYLYYFVTNCQIGANNQVMFDLRLDTIQTYFFDDNIQFGDCLIERAHLNRFLQDPDDETKVMFDGRPESKLFLTETTQPLAKRLTKRTRLSINTGIKEDIDQWLKQNVIGWQYYFLSAGKYKEYAKSGTNISIIDVEREQIYYFIDNSLISNIQGAIIAIAYPVFSENAPINALSITTANGNIIISRDGLNEFVSRGVEILSTKFSIIPPFDIGSLIDYSISGRYLNINGEFTNLGVVAGNTRVMAQGKMGNNYYGMFVYRFQNVDRPLNIESYSIEEKINFTKNEIITADSVKQEFNPKLNGANYKDLTISLGSSDKFNYDIQKLNTTELNLQYSEPIDGETTACYLRAKTDGVYIPECAENYTGLVSLNSNTLAFANDQLALYFANNKNFYQMRSAKQWGQTGQSVISAAASGAAIGSVVPGLGTAVGAVVGTASGLISSALSMFTDKLNSDKTLDNMREAPDQISNANTNAVLNLAVTQLQIYVEEYSALPYDLETANMFMHRFGYACKTAGNIKDFINIRHYFNYVQATIENVSGIPLSNIARADIRQRFQSGIRFWKSDTIDYSKENYENWLED